MKEIKIEQNKKPAKQHKPRTEKTKKKIKKRDEIKQTKLNITTCINVHISCL